LVGAADAEAWKRRQAWGSEGFGGGGGGCFGGHGEYASVQLSEWGNGLRHDYMHAKSRVSRLFVASLASGSNPLASVVT